MAETAQTEGGIDQAFLDEFLPRWEEAWKSHQPERVLELMTDDIVYDDSASPTTMRGHADVRAFLEGIWRAFPDSEFERTDGPLLQTGAPKAAFFWRGNGTHTGPLDPPGFAPTGKRIEFDGVDCLKFREGRVSRLRVIYDVMDLARQLGTVPQAGSRAEKVMAAAQRLTVQARAKLSR